MSPIIPLLAADMPIPGTSKVPGMVASDLVMIIGLAALIFTAFIAYVVFIRGPKNQVPARRIYKSSDESSSSSGRKRKRKKTRRREHRQSNPTLAQTGGLPPPRNPEQTPAS